MTSFLVLLVAQGLSLIGSMASGWAVGLWVFETTHSQTWFALVALAGTLPGIALSLFAGVWVDRVAKRRAMLVADGVALIGPALLAILAASPSPPLAGLAVAVAIGSACSALLRPAFFAASTFCVAPGQLPRIAGLSQAMWSAATLFAPLIGAALVTRFGLRGVAVLDLVTFGVALLATAIVPFTEARRTAALRATYREELRAGLSLIGRDGTLVALLGFFACLNLVWSMYEALLLPVLVEISDPTAAARVMMLAGAGAVLGALAVGGRPPRRPLRAMVVVALGLIVALAAQIASSVIVVAAAATASSIAVGALNALSQQIWQTTVPPELHGRTFAVRGTIAWSTVTLGYLAIGPIVEHVLAPLCGGHAEVARRIGFGVLAAVAAVGAVLLATAPRARSTR